MNEIPNSHPQYFSHPEEQEKGTMSGQVFSDNSKDLDTPYYDKRDGMSDLTSPSAKKQMPDFNMIEDSEEENFRMIDRS